MRRLCLCYLCKTVWIGVYVGRSAMLLVIHFLRIGAFLGCSAGVDGACGRSLVLAGHVVWLAIGWASSGHLLGCMSRAGCTLCA